MELCSFLEELENLLPSSFINDCWFWESKNDDF